MADESYGSVGTPRIYVDYVQYAKSIGMVEEFKYRDDSLECSNPESLWDFNPSSEVKFTVTVPKGYYDFQARFKDSIQFKHLVSTANYGALLGHNVGSLGVDRYVESRLRTGHANHTSILGSDNKLRNNVGTNIWKINQFQGDLGFEHYNELGFKILDGTSTVTFNVGDVFNFNAYSIGRYFDLPHSANLSLNQTISYDGVQSKRTIGGSDLTQVNYLRPKFGDYTPFHNIDLLESTDYQQVINDNDFSTAGFQGRRSWDLSFSYISKEDMFPRTFTNNTAGYYSGASGEELGENLISNGGFGNTSSWGTNGGVTITGGVASFAGDGAYANVSQNILTIGKTYKLTLKCTANVSGGKIGIDQNSGDTTLTYNIVPAGETGEFTIYFQAVNKTNLQIYRNPYDKAVSIDNVSCQEVQVPANEFFDDGGNSTGMYNDNIVNNWLNLTLGGQIPFIFQPDKDKTEFAIVKMDKPSMKIEQVAHQVYDFSVKLIEVF